MIYLSEKAKMYIYLLGGLVFVGIASGMGGFLLAALPFAIAITFLLLNNKYKLPELELDLKTEELVEKSDGRLKLFLTATDKIPLLSMRHSWEIVNFGTVHFSDMQIALDEHESRELALIIPTDKGPGRYELGKFYLSSFDSSGMLYYTQERDFNKVLTVFPTINALENVKQINKPRLYHGNYTSKNQGEGLEFSEIKEYRHGDSLRHINWKKSLKWGDLLVNERYLDRNIDVVILVETLTQISGKGGDYLTTAARGAASLAHHYTQRKDRVGLIKYDGTIDAMLPQSGEAQFKQILTKLANLKKSYSFVARGVKTIPRRILPPQGVVYGFTSLSDDRVYNVFLDLAARGFNLILIYIDPQEIVNGKDYTGKEIFNATNNDKYQKLAADIWKQKQEIKISALKRLGATIVKEQGKGDII